MQPDVLHRGEPFLALAIERMDPRSDARPGVNLLGMRTEVEKLLTAKPGASHWHESDLDQIVSYREDHEIGKLQEAIAERHLAPAIERLRALLPAFFFNHEVIEYEVEGERRWADATLNMQGGNALNRSAPYFRVGLPLGPDSQGLETLPLPANRRRCRRFCANSCVP